MAIMSSLAMISVADRYQLSFKSILVIVFICFIPKTLEPFYGLKNLLFGVSTNETQSCQVPFVQPSEYSKKQLGLWIKANTRLSDLVYIAGTGSTIQAYSERLSPTIYFNATQTRNAKAKLYADLLSNRPGWILVPLFAEYKMHIHIDTRNFIDSLISKHYRYIQCIYGYSLYQRVEYVPGQ
jgi:hypothetical protein